MAAQHAVADAAAGSEGLGGAGAKRASKKQPLSPNTSINGEADRPTLPMGALCDMLRFGSSMRKQLSAAARRARRATSPHRYHKHQGLEEDMQQRQQQRDILAGGRTARAEGVGGSHTVYVRRHTCGLGAVCRVEDGGQPELQQEPDEQQPQEQQGSGAAAAVADTPTKNVAADSTLPPRTATPAADPISPLLIPTSTSSAQELQPPSLWSLKALSSARDRTSGTEQPPPMWSIRVPGRVGRPPALQLQITGGDEAIRGAAEPHTARSMALYRQQHETLASELRSMQAQRTHSLSTGQPSSCGSPGAVTVGATFSSSATFRAPRLSQLLLMQLPQPSAQPQSAGSVSPQPTPLPAVAAVGSRAWLHRNASMPAQAQLAGRLGAQAGLFKSRNAAATCNSNT